MEERDLDVGIRELIKILPAAMGPVVEKACQKNLRDHPRIERSRFKIEAQPHSYGPNATKICDGPHGKLVFDDMCNDGRCSAPTFSRAPIYTGKSERLFPFDDLVGKLVNPADQTIYNVTLPEHIFFPGYVKLAVVETRAMTAVAVSGQGMGNWMWPNTRLGPRLFEAILKEHLAPRVQRQLRSAAKFRGGGGSSGGAGAGSRW